MDGGPAIPDHWLPVYVIDVDFSHSARINRFFFFSNATQRSWNYSRQKKKKCTGCKNMPLYKKILLYIFTHFFDELASRCTDWTAYPWADSRRWSRPSPPGWGWAGGWRAGWCWSWRSPGTSWPRWARSCGSPASGRPGRTTGRCAAWAARTGGRGEGELCERRDPLTERRSKPLCVVP